MKKILIVLLAFVATNSFAQLSNLTFSNGNLLISEVNGKYSTNLKQIQGFVYDSTANPKTFTFNAGNTVRTVFWQHFNSVTLDGTPLVLTTPAALKNALAGYIQNYATGGGGGGGGTALSDSAFIKQVRDSVVVVIANTKKTLDSLSKIIKDNRDSSTYTFAKLSKVNLDSLQAIQKRIEAKDSTTLSRKIVSVNNLISDSNFLKSGNDKLDSIAFYTKRNYLKDSVLVGTAGNTPSNGVAAMAKDDAGVAQYLSINPSGFLRVTDTTLYNLTTDSIRTKLIKLDSQLAYLNNQILAVTGISSTNGESGFKILGIDEVAGNIAVLPIYNGTHTGFGAYDNRFNGVGISGLSYSLGLPLPLPVEQSADATATRLFLPIGGYNTNGASLSPNVVSVDANGSMLVQLDGNSVAKTIDVSTISGVGTTAQDSVAMVGVLSTANGKAFNLTTDDEVNLNTNSHIYDGTRSLSLIAPNTSPNGNEVSMPITISPNSPDGKTIWVSSGGMGTGSVTTTANLLNASSTSFESDLNNITYGGNNGRQMARSISSQVTFTGTPSAGTIIVVGSNDNSTYKVIPFWAGNATQNMTYGFTYNVAGSTTHFFEFNTPYRFVKLYVNTTVTGATDVLCASTVSPFEISRKTININDGTTNVAIKAAVTAATSNDGSLVTQENPNTQSGANFTVTGNAAHTTAGAIGTGANLIAATLNSGAQTNLITYGTVVNTSANSKQWNSFVTQINCNASVTSGTVIFEGSNDGVTTNYKPIYVSVNGAAPTSAPVALTAGAVIMVSGNVDYKFINFRLATIAGAGAAVGGITNFSAQKISFSSASGGGTAGDIIAASTSVLATNTAQSVQLNPNGNTVKIGGNAYTQSTGNNTTTQLASLASFTGTVESALGFSQILVSMRCDQATTVIVRQYQDAAGLVELFDYTGTPITLTIAANGGVNRAISLVGSYYKLVVTNTGGAATTALNLETWSGNFPSTPNITNKGNLPVSITEVFSTSQNSITTTITTGNTAQVLMTANANRNGFEIQNNSLGDLWFTIGGTAAIGTGFKIIAGGSYSSPSSRSAINAISIIGATTGQSFTYLEYK